MGHVHFTFIVMDHVGPNQYSSHFDHSLSVSNVYCSGLEVFTTKVDRTFTLIQMNSIMCGSAEQETNTHKQQFTYQDLVLVNIYLTHNTQPHTKHTRMEHATQGTVMTYVTCAQYTMVSTELQHCACLWDKIWSRNGEREERALFTKLITMQNGLSQ